MSSIAAARRGLPDPTNGVNRTEHPGLVIDRFVPFRGDANNSLKEVFSRACQAGASEVYATAYARWEQALRDLHDVGARRFAVRTRLLVGLGAESVHETAISLHRTYGMPIIPGSALKGLARAYAEASLWGANGDAPACTPEQHAVLFGDTKSAAYFCWFDAWYCAGSAGNRPLALDVLTVHHPHYYQTRGKQPQKSGSLWQEQGRSLPTDFDDPNPVPLVSARGEYLVAVRGPSPDWTAFALGLLGAALAEWGVGAKTSSGYGRLDEVPNTELAGVGGSTPPDERGRAQQSERPHPAAAPVVAQIESTTDARLPGQAKQLYDQCLRLSDAAAKRQAAAALLQRLEKSGRDRGRWAYDRPWVAELRRYVETR